MTGDPVAFVGAVAALDDLCGEQVHATAEMNGRPVLSAKGLLQRTDDEARLYLPPGAGDVALFELAGDDETLVALPVFADALVEAGTSVIGGGMRDGEPAIGLIYGDGFLVRITLVAKTEEG